MYYLLCTPSYVNVLSTTSNDYVLYATLYYVLCTTYCVLHAMYCLLCTTCYVILAMYYMQWLRAMYYVLCTTCYVIHAMYYVLCSICYVLTPWTPLDKDWNVAISGFVTWVWRINLSPVLKWLLEGLETRFRVHIGYFEDGEFNCTACGHLKGQRSYFQRSKCEFWCFLQVFSV